MDLKQEEQQNNQDVQSTKIDNKRKVKDPTLLEVPKGKPKSGRIWKTEKKKFSSIIKSRGLKSSLQKKQVLREELKRIKEASRAIIASKKEEKLLKKQRRQENLKRQEENRKKSEVVQIIKNPAKIKRMRKKQLRYIEKRDITNM